MISLDVENYCQNCTDFEPKKEVMKFMADSTLVKACTTVFCKHKRKCASVAKKMANNKKREADTDEMFVN